MKRLLLGAAILILCGGTAVKLSRRWHEERADRRLALLVDWSEVRDWTAREGMTDEELFQRLRYSGVTALLLGASTVQDYLWQDPSLAQPDLVFSNRNAAETVLHQLLYRGVIGVSLKQIGPKYRLVNQLKNWELLKDLEVGFNPGLVDKIRKAGLHLVLRVNQDPWLAGDYLFHDLQAIAGDQPETGFLLNTDEVPGGPDALPKCRAFLERQSNAQLFFEFHPSKSAVKLGFRSPAFTFRAHTIPANELRDMTESEQRSRWRRAVEERSCRFLLFHVSPNDSLSSFFWNIQSTRLDFLRHGWEIAWPKPRWTWKVPSAMNLQLGSFLAFWVAVLSPIAALRAGRHKNPWASFFQIVFFTLAGACLVAALADNPLTRLELVPFRGIKMAFVLAWAGSVFTLYSWREIKELLFQNVRRIDIAAGLVVLAIVGYILIRMGNASAGWKVGWEQGLRDRLEELLIARPRFKEFVVGYPLLLLGLSLPFSLKSKPFWQEGRFWIAVGMIGPISMVNTFCHLHSPLVLAFWRSANGIFIGAALGFLLVKAWRCAAKELF